MYIHNLIYKKTSRVRPILLINSGTSTILVAMGPQDPTVHVTQGVWMAVAPPLFVANKN